MEGDPSRLAAALTQLVQEITATGEAGMAQRLCLACAEAMPVDGVGISLLAGWQRGAQALLGASDETAAAIEQLQFELGEGPCLTAFTEARPVRVPDISGPEAGSRWPVFTTQAAENGLSARALFAFPMQVGAVGLGVLDFYRTEPGPLGDEAYTLLLVETVTWVLLKSESAKALDRDESDTGDAATGPPASSPAEVSWQLRAEVHQAAGMVSAQLGVSTEAALARIRSQAFLMRRPVTAIAGDVISGRVRFTDQD